MITIEIQKEVMRSKVIAQFSHYRHGNLYYTVELKSGTYMFPLSTIDKVGENITLSSDLGITDFGRNIKAATLNRWIRIANESNNFLKIK